MSLSLPIFPGFQPNQSFTQQPRPMRSPQWNYKKTQTWNNFSQRSVSGRTTTVKYWNNPLWLFEWKFGYLYDDPTNQNSFYSAAPIPSTDFQTLEAFFGYGMGRGNLFAFMPPNSLYGGTYGASGGTVTVANNQVTVSGLPAGTATALASYVGKLIYFYNFATATFLNGKYLYLVSVNTGSNTITCAITHAAYGPTSDTGTITVGQILAAPDANNNIEIVSSYGAYPSLTGQTYNNSWTSISESVQLMDTATLVLYDGAGTNITSHATIGLPNSTTPPAAYLPYAGYVAQFSTYTILSQPVTASFQFYYNCLFHEDEQEYENWMTMLWMCSTCKFDHVRV